MFQIEKNVPVPSGRCMKYPFADMKVGDSFVAPKETVRGAQKAAWNWARDHDVKFATRTQRDGSLRIWRIS